MSADNLFVTKALELYSDALDWCTGRSWLLRLPLWLFMGYIALNQLWDEKYRSIFAGVNLPIHEGGHLLFRSFGDFLYILGGTLLEILAPIGVMIGFLKQRDYFGISVGLGWLSTVFYDVAVYMADAQKQVLPLVTVGDAAFIRHDWNELLRRLGLLNQCEALGWLTRQVGNLSMLACLALGAWLMWRMYNAPQPTRRATRAL